MSDQFDNTSSSSKRFIIYSAFHQIDIGIEESIISRQVSDVCQLLVERVNGISRISFKYGGIVITKSAVLDENHKGIDDYLREIEEEFKEVSKDYGVITGSQGESEARLEMRKKATEYALYEFRCLINDPRFKEKIPSIPLITTTQYQAISRAIGSEKNDIVDRLESSGQISSTMANNLRHRN